MVWPHRPHMWSNCCHLENVDRKKPACTHTQTTYLQRERMHKQILRPKKESCSNGTDGPGRDKFSCRSPAVSQQITHLPLNTTGFYGVQTLSKTPSYFSLKIENKDNRLKSVIFSCTTRLRKNAAKLAATLSKSWSARSCLYSFTRPSPFYTKNN